uniref:(northern house mosquito) hypothetical protein n=1 Tax=Culex pipiens TaxID=7175 RepID=A0A8D8GQT7_CULPI
MRRVRSGRSSVACAIGGTNRRGICEVINGSCTTRRCTFARRAEKASPRKTRSPCTWPRTNPTRSSRVQRAEKSTNTSRTCATASPGTSAPSSTGARSAT